ncbi:MAG: SMP-30/gluconolactonase/LRE family protein [Oceanicaulis sp.]|nr:SMP-30/gluconolactonase/LRE family protein [Oceanicaulis sp.]
MSAALRIGTPHCVWDARAILGEGPVWDGQAVWWTDIKAPALHRYEPQTGAKTSWTAPEAVGSFVIEPDGRLLAAMKSGFARLTLDAGGGAMTVASVCRPEADLPGNRFNDGKRAPDGSFWAGTMDDAEQGASGAWWRLDAGGTARQLETGYRVTNGPAFDAARGRVYLTDSARQTVFAADLSDGGAGFSNKRVFVQFGEGDGYPDGMETDADGCLWIAFWDGWRIDRYDPDGALMARVDMPVARPTSLAFAGDAVYVTSASIGLDGQALAGGLFRIDLQGR